MTDVFDIGEEGSADLKLTEVSEDTIELTQGKGWHKKNFLRPKVKP